MQETETRACLAHTLPTVLQPQSASFLWKLSSRSSYQVYCIHLVAFINRIDRGEDLPLVGLPFRMIARVMGIVAY